MSTAVKVIFFDAAGTLIAPVESVGLTYSRIAAQVGVKAPSHELDVSFREAWRAHPPPLHPVGRPPLDDDRSWWREVAGQTFTKALGAPLPADVMDPLFEKLYAHYAEPAAWRLFDEVKPALHKLCLRHRLIVVSNFDRRLLKILSGHGLMDMFEKVILSSEVGASKPHPRIFQAALLAADEPAAACLHVGDDPKCDVEGAEMAGMRFFGVQRPGNGLDVLVRLLDLA
jgi:putative hydrolase of the HAD superfamily